MEDWKTLAGRFVLEAVRRTGAARLGALATRPYGAIFTLHHVSPEPLGNFPPNGHLRIAPDFLSAIIAHLRGIGCDFVDLHEAVRRIEAGPSRPGRFFAAFTLDDGYCNNRIHAAPIFVREKVPYAVFVSPGLSEGTVLAWWEIIEQVVRDNDRVVLPGDVGEMLPAVSASQKRQAFDRLSLHLTHECLETEIGDTVRRIAAANGLVAADAASRVMDWSDLAALACDPLCTIGAHSMTHPRLSRLGAAAVADELSRSREVIAERLGRRPDFFAYPYGSRSACGTREFEIAARLGFRASFTTRLHALTTRSAADLQALPRLSLNGYYQDPRYVDVLMSGLPGLWKERGL